MDNDPGNRFCPTEEQIISHYIEGKMQGRHFPNVIHEINICNFDPWDLPEQAAWQSNDPVWYFFSEPDYKYANSTRMNRKTKAGYWKPTGNERTIRDMHGREIGIKKNLVFYQASSSKKGTKTNWVMHEYHSHNARFYQKPFVLFRLKRKSDDDDSDTCDQMASQQSQENHELPSDLQSIHKDEKSQLDTKDQELDNFLNSIWASDEDEHLHEETVQTRLQYNFKPVKSLSGYVASSSNFRPSAAVSLSLGNILEIEIGQACGMTMTNSRLKSDGSIGSNRKRSYIFLETPPSSHKQYPPISVYIENIVVALILLVFFVREMVSSLRNACLIGGRIQAFARDLVGYRFHPSDEEIVSYYLARKLRGLDFSVNVINEVDINKFEPWDLPDFAEIQSDDPVWYFFNKLDYMDAKRKRINRKTKAGFWKVTGRDRLVKDKRGREIGCKKTLVFHLGRTPDGIKTHWVMQEFHYKDADKEYQRPFVLCRLKSKSDDGDEPSPSQLASNSGNFIVPQENHELSLDLQSFFNNDERHYNSLSAVQFVMDDEPDDDELSLDLQSFLNNDEPDDDELSLDLQPFFNNDELDDDELSLDLQPLSSVQFLMPTAQGPSCSNGSINELDAVRSQLNTREQDDDFLNSIWASDEDQHLHEENVQTRLHDFKPVKPLSGYVAASGNLPVEQSGSSRGDGSIMMEAAGNVSIWAFTTHEHLHEETAQTHRQHFQQAAKPMVKPKEPEKKPREKPEKTKKPPSRKGSYIYLETPPWSHEQYPPSIYIVNIVVALLLFVFFVREMVSLH
ncbi:hypothetical protein EZV62_010133 [Acer yangbiense]|uniref:NAC domain-containing protein n=1 Tax=Acer yangbiense TaxID=1000413 RepID=A0A5C7I2E8_9ROSI|nr:hypothetical protein EZV62_010133 [Acer yangbiense]